MRHEIRSELGLATVDVEKSCSSVVEHGRYMPKVPGSISSGRLFLKRLQASELPKTSVSIPEIMKNCPSESRQQRQARGKLHLLATRICCNV